MFRLPSRFVTKCSALAVCMTALFNIGADSGPSKIAYAHSVTQGTSNVSIVGLKFRSYEKGIEYLVTNGFDVTGVDYPRSIIYVAISDTESLNTVLKNARQQFQIVETHDISPGLVPEEGYKTPDELTTILRNIAENHPQIVRLESIGKSLESRDIWAVKISDNVNQHELSEPVVFFNAMHHAREVMSTEASLDIIEHLVSQYASQDSVNKWVNNNEIWVIPMVNPDGNNMVWTGQTMWRKNVRGGYGVDINRNYPFKWGACRGSSGDTRAQDYRGPSAASEPETQAMINFVNRIKPVTSISFHSYSELVLYPYGCQGQHAETRAVIEDMGRSMAGLIPRDSGEGAYTPGTPWEILYSVDGGDIDWYYHDHQSIPFVIEVNSASNGFQPPYSLRDPTVQKLRLGWGYLLDRLEGSGIRGVVVGGPQDSLNNVMIEVYMQGQESQQILIQTYQVNPDGTFHIVLHPGNYTLSVRAPGHETSQHQIAVDDKLQRVRISL